MTMERAQDPFEILEANNIMDRLAQTLVLPPSPLLIAHREEVRERRPEDSDDPTQIVRVSSYVGKTVLTDKDGNISYGGSMTFDAPPKDKGSILIASANIMLLGGIVGENNPRTPADVYEQASFVEHSDSKAAAESVTRLFTRLVSERGGKILEKVGKLYRLNPLAAFAAALEVESKGGYRQPLPFDSTQDVQGAKYYVFNVPELISAVKPIDLSAIDPDDSELAEGMPAGKPKPPVQRRPYRVPKYTLLDRRGVSNGVSSLAPLYRAAGEEPLYIPNTDADPHQDQVRLRRERPAQPVSSRPEPSTPEIDFANLPDDITETQRALLTRLQRGPANAAQLAKALGKDFDEFDVEDMGEELQELLGEDSGVRLHIVHSKAQPAMFTLVSLH